MSAPVPDRIEAPAHTDAWMRGDRYGTILSRYTFGGEDRVRVRMDKSGDVLRFPATLVTYVR